jgi:hypothetical protein
MRRALLLLVLAASACGDPAPAAAPRPAPVAQVPFEDAFDDAKLDALMFDSARSGKLDALSSLKLPARCDRVRAAVHALHEHLLGAVKPPPDRAQLLAAFDALARADGGASAKALGPLAAAWRGWTDDQAAAEGALARRAAAGFEVLARKKIDPRSLAEAMKGSQEPPPKSPAAAQIAVLRAALLAITAPDDSAVPREVADAYTHAEDSFEALGWPGGFGSAADALAKRLLAANARSRIGTNLADRAQAAYARSGDEVRASLVFLTLSDAAERAGDLKTAEYLAGGGRDRLVAAHGTGRELFDVMLRHGALAQRLGKQAEAARDLGVAWREAQASRLGAAECVDAAEKLATSLFYVGRLAEVRDVTAAAMKLHDDAVAAGGKPVEPSRTTLAEFAAQAALETGHLDDALRLYREAAARYAAAADADVATRQSRDTDELFAAQAQLRAGDADGAARAIEAVTSRDGVQPGALAHAASIWREAKRFDAAEIDLTRAESMGGAALKEALIQEHARLAAARGDSAGARALFEKAVARVDKGDDKPVGWEAASVLRDWAKVEFGLGRLYEASELAGRAIVQLRDSGLDMERDRARKLYVDIERRRLWFGEAEKAAAQRIAAGPPGDDARRDDALLDVFLIRLELTLKRQKDAANRLAEAAAAFPEGWRRDAATHVAKSVTSDERASHDSVVVPPDAPPRWTLLRDVASADGDALALAKRCGADEPELRRWAASRVDPKGGRVREAIELRRGMDDFFSKGFVDRPDEAVLLVEPLGGRMHVLVVRGGAADADFDVADGDAGLAGFWDAVNVDPSAEHLASAAKRVSSALFTDAVVKSLDGVKRLWVSVSEPLGPLPFDLLPFGDGLLIDRFDVLTVKSAAELARARTRAEPPMLTTLVSPYASLDTRHALVAFGTPDAKARARLFELIGAAENKGEDAATALREAKLALRAETKDAAPAKGVPAWAVFLLRGAP